jgi:hypothetical protein
LLGYAPGQILYDGCEECEARGKDVSMALANLDPSRFAAAWMRAFDDNASAGNFSAIRECPVSVAERPLLAVLWGVMVQLERRGVPLDGFAPDGITVAL